MVVEAEYRPVVPVIDRGEENDQEENALSSPFDLEGNIRTLVEQERISYQQAKAQFERASGAKEPDFNAALWMRRKLVSMSREQTEKEAANFMFDLKTAWDVVAFLLYDEDSQDTAKSDLSTYAELFDRRSVLLNPLGVRLLDAMAAATDIPNYTPGQHEIELSRAIELTEVSDLFTKEAGV
jgi:hypothetical protein